MRAPPVYQALLYCYPAAFRNEYGHQMVEMFAAQVGDARRTGDRLQEAALWLRAWSDALTIAPKEHLHVIQQDLRYAVRVLAARPGFAAVAILSLAIGIGANTAIFGLWNGMLRASLPGVPRAEELVILTNPGAAGGWHGDTSGDRDWLTYEEFGQLRDRVQTLSGLMASESALAQLQVRFPGGGWEAVQGRMVSGGYFQLLGVNPALGRFFSADSDRVEAYEAVISYQYWQRRFAGRPEVLGKSFTLQKASLTIVGVAAPGFIGETAGQQPDFWVPLRLQPAVLPGDDWLHDSPPSKSMWLHAFGRLRPGVTPGRAEAEVNAIFRAGLESFYGAVAPGRREKLLDQHLKVRPAARGASETRVDFSNSLTALLAGVGLLLLIACANLANLLLARGAVRRSEMALRLSLGASRGRLIRQLLTESLVLAVAGGFAGLAMAYFFHGALAGMLAHADRYFRMTFALDPLVLAFTTAVTLAAATLFGLLPAWQVTKTDAGASLKEQARGLAGGKMRWGRSLVSLQMALSLPLLAGAGLLARTVYNLQHVELGYPSERLLLAGVNSRAEGYNSARSAVVFREMQAEIQRVPGVKSVSYSQNGVFNGTASSTSIAVEGYTPKEGEDDSVSLELVGSDYFSTLGVPMVLGRDVQSNDLGAAPAVCVINEAFAKRYFGRRNPMGAGVRLLDNMQRTLRVVGVARNHRTQNLRAEIEPRIYLPTAQVLSETVKRATFLIRTASEGGAMAPALRQAMQRVDPQLPMLWARTVDEQITPLTATDRAMAQLAVVFGLVALTLAAIGLYGVLSYGIARRRNEIAVRIALGAKPGRVVGMILGETAGLIVGGLVVGAGLAYAASSLIHSSLYGVAPADPLSLLAAVTLLVAVALGAAYLPARRAARLDPMAALRQE